MKCPNCQEGMVRIGNKETKEPKLYCPKCHSIIIDKVVARG